MSFESSVYNMPRGQVTRVYEGSLGEVRETKKFSKIFPVNIDRNRDTNPNAPLSLASQMVDLFRRCYFYLAGYTRVTLEVSLKSDSFQTQRTEFYVLRKELNTVDRKTDDLAQKLLAVESDELNPSVTNRMDLTSLTNQQTDLQKEIAYIKKGIDKDRRGELQELITEEQDITNQIAALLSALHRS